MNGHFAGCGRYRGSLLDFVDRRDQGPDTAAALEHLDRCAHCRSELEATALAITALRRLGADARASEPGADAWQRVRNRIAERGAVWRWRSSVAGLAVGAVMLALSGDLSVTAGVPWSAIEVAAGLGLVLPVVASLYPARLAARVSIAQALRFE